MTLAQSFDQRFVSGFEYAAIVCESWKKLGATLPGYGFVLLGECVRVLFESLDTKELCLKRFLFRIVRRLTDQRHQRFEELTHEADLDKYLHTHKQGAKEGNFRISFVRCTWYFVLCFFGKLQSTKYKDLCSILARDARFRNRSGKPDDRVGRC